MNELLTVKDAAAYLGLKPRTLDNKRWSGDGPPFYKVGGKFVRYDREDLDAWARSSRFHSTSEAKEAAQ